MPSSMPRLLLLLGICVPGVASAQLTPGLCVGYMPVVTAFEADAIENQTVSEHSGSLHLLRAREVRQSGEAYSRMANQMQRLQRRDFTSDFEQDRMHAVSIGQNHVEVLRAGAPELRQQANQEYRSVQQECAGLLAKARSLSSASAFEALMESMESSGTGAN